MSKKHRTKKIIVFIKRCDLKELSGCDTAVQKLAGFAACEEIKFEFSHGTEDLVKLLESQGWGGVAVVKEEVNNAILVHLDWTPGSRANAPVPVTAQIAHDPSKDKPAKPWTPPASATKMLGEIEEPPQPSNPTVDRILGGKDSTPVVTKIPGLGSDAEVIVKKRN